MSTDDVPVLSFAEGLPGFPDARELALVRLDDEGLVYDLQTLDAEPVRLVVVPSAAFFPDFAPEIDAATAAGLGLETADDALVLLVVTIGPTLAESTVNLAAPVVVCSSTRRAAQVLLDRADLPLRAALPAPAPLG